MFKVARTLIAVLLLCSIAAAQPVHPFSAVGKVIVEYGDTTNAGSGTLIAVNRAQGKSLVYTCAHIWESNRKYRQIVVAFGSGALTGKIAKWSRVQDLCLIELNGCPAETPVTIGPITKDLTIGGYGEQRLQFQKGSFGKHYTDNEGFGAGYREINGAWARSGDSGGPVFNKYGEMCGVLWGSGGVGTMASDHNSFIKFCNDYLNDNYNIEEKQQWCPGGQCGRPTYGGGWSSVPSTRPASPGTRRVVPYDKPFPSRPDAIAVPRPPRPATPSCKNNCGKRLTDLEAAVEALKNEKRVPGPAGPKGDPGPPGPAGKDGNSADPDAIANLIFAKLEQRLTNIESRLEDNDEQEPGEGVIYYRIVADPEASYWKRLEDYYKRAEESYSQIKVVPPPDYPVGQLPAMVAYRGGVPLGTFRGRDVENALADISRGNVPMPTR